MNWNSSKPLPPHVRCISLLVFLPELSDKIPQALETGAERTPAQTNQDGTSRTALVRSKARVLGILP